MVSALHPSETAKLLPKARSPRARVSGPPSMEEIRQWIIKGKFDDAERALRRRLTDNPRDMAVLRLLAICQRKSGQSTRAVETYRRIIANGNGEDQNAARSKAGVILQDQLGRHGEAAHLFESYLRAPPGLRSNTLEARMRLAKSLKKTNQSAAYKRMLGVIVKEHGGTEAAIQAAKELEALR